MARPSVGIVGRGRMGTALAAGLRAAGYEVVAVRDAPDRPGLEFVLLARRTE